MSGYLSKSSCSKEGLVIWSTNFRGNGGSPINDCWHQKTRIPGLSCGVVCVILSLAFLKKYRRVTDRHTLMANTCASIASCG